MRTVLVISLLLAGLVPFLAEEVKPVYGVFEVRRFFYDSILQKEYGDKLSVNFVPGATPELILYDENKQEISREFVNNMSFDELHAFVQAKGFNKVVAEPEVEAEQEPEELAEAAELEKQQAEAAGTAEQSEL